MRVYLKNRSLLNVSGSDSESFLQGQLSNDISKLGEYEIQINAYCQHQGKIIGLFWVMRYEDNFLLSFKRGNSNQMIFFDAYKIDYNKEYRSGLSYNIILENKEQRPLGIQRTVCIER